MKYITYILLIHIGIIRNYDNDPGKFWNLKKKETLICMKDKQNSKEKFAFQLYTYIHTYIPSTLSESSSGTSVPNEYVSSLNISDEYTIILASSSLPQINHSEMLL
jgi:hypothetical protein